jgi:LPS sulfotransferase NodH
MKNLFNLKRKSNHKEDIIIVSGLPRSGTSLMMKMLEAGGLPPLTDNLRKADIENPNGYYEFERVKKLNEGDAGWLPEAQGKAVKVISALLPYLPPNFHYKVLFMRRALPEVLASQRKMLIGRGEDPNEVSDEEITRSYQKHLRQVDGWVASHANIQRLDIDYNQLVLDPLPLIAQVNQFLGGWLEEANMAAVVNPALYRQRSGK